MQAHTQTHAQLFLSHAPRAFICSVHTALTNQCKHSAEEGKGRVGVRALALALALAAALGPDCVSDIPLSPIPQE